MIISSLFAGVCPGSGPSAIFVVCCSVTGMLVLEILVRRTNIFAGKYGPPAFLKIGPG